MVSEQDRPKTIQIYLPFGDPRGIRLAWLTTRIVRVIEVPREQLERFAAMQGVGQVAVCFLVGQQADRDSPSLYIGHTQRIATRLREHKEKRAFWTTALIAVTNDDTLTPTHTQYLEGRSIKGAREMSRYDLENQTAGSQPRIPAHLRAECEEIFETMGTLLSTLGLPVFEASPSPDSSLLREGLLLCQGSDADGRGYYGMDGLVVLKGSSGRRENGQSILGSSGERLRNRLLEDGVVRIEGERRVFQRDHPFTSPSSAAAVVMGRSANGWIEWKDERGKTLQELTRS